MFVCTCACVRARARALVRARTCTCGIPAEQGWVRSTLQDTCATSLNPSESQAMHPDPLRYRSVKVDRSSSIDLGNPSTSDGFSNLALKGALPISDSIQIAWNESGSDLSDPSKSIDRARSISEIRQNHEKPSLREINRN